MLDNYITYLSQIAKENNLTEVLEIINSISEIKIQKYIDIAVLGQFKAGKSSFINSLINTDILPTGVIPVTSVVTRLSYAPEEKITITFLSGQTKDISRKQLPEYITEELNPNNKLGVKIADIFLPSMKQFPNIRLIDTPGIGSIFINNTETTNQWAVNVTVALILISAERPLSQEDKNLILSLKPLSFQMACVISKADLFDDKQISQIKNFIEKSLTDILGKHIPIFLYSTKKNSQLYKNQIINQLLKKYSENTSAVLNKIIIHKIKTAAILTKNYFSIVLQTAKQNQLQRQILQQKIFTHKTNANAIYRQLQVISSDLKSHTRDKIFKLLNQYKSQITQSLINDFKTVYPTWKYNLYKVSRSYEQWLKNSLKVQFQNIITEISPQLNKILVNAADNLKLFVSSFEDNLINNVYQALNIQLTRMQWNPRFKPIQNPDVSVYKAFDSNIDLLWFIIPMWLLRGTFMKYFLKQIPLEVEKNIYRITSALTGKINKQIEDLTQQSIKHLISQVKTIEQALAAASAETEKISNKISEIDSIIKALDQWHE